MDWEDFSTSMASQGLMIDSSIPHWCCRIAQILYLVEDEDIRHHIFRAHVRDLRQAQNVSMA